MSGALSNVTSVLRVFFISVKAYLHPLHMHIALVSQLTALLHRSEGEVAHRSDAVHQEQQMVDLTSLAVLDLKLLCPALDEVRSLCLLQTR